MFDEAEQHGSIVTMQEPNLLVAQSQDVFSIYGLRQYPAMENKTGIYLVMTHDESAATDLVNGPDLFRALEAMPFDVVPEIYEDAKAHLKTIKTLVDEAVKTPMTYAAKRGAHVQKSSIDPNKSPVESIAGLEGMPIVSLRLVWVVFIFFAIPIFLNPVFLAASLLAVNWLSMGRPRKAVAALVTSIAVWGLFAVPIQIVFGGSSLSPRWPFSIALALQLIPAAGVIFWQTKQQHPAYQQAVERYGKPSGWTCRNIIIAIVVIILGSTMANTWLRIFYPIASRGSAALISPQTYTDDRITLNYPLSWVPTDLSGALCEDQNVECLLVATEQRNRTLVVLQNNDFFGFLRSLEGLSQYDMDAIASNPEHVSDDAQIKRWASKIDGRDAIKYQYRYSLKKDLGKAITVGTVLYIRDDNDWIRLYIYTPVEAVSIADDIINSVHFVTPLDD